MNTVLTQAVAQFLLLPIFITALAVLVKGYVDVGDGFSAGVIAAVGVLLQYLAFNYEEVERRLPFLRYVSRLALASLLLVLAVAFAPLLLGQPIVTHFPPPGAETTSLDSLKLHTAMLFDLGVFGLVFGLSVSIIRLIAQINTSEEAQ
jgi:multisubunit Na+/H+ antiporter MnhB subunit